MHNKDRAGDTASPHGRRARRGAGEAGGPGRVPRRGLSLYGVLVWVVVWGAAAWLAIRYWGLPGYALVMAAFALASLPWLWRARGRAGDRANNRVFPPGGSG